MVSILQKSLSLVFFIFVGQLFRRIGLLKKEDFQALSRVMMRVTLPCAIVYNFSRMDMQMTMFALVFLGVALNAATLMIGYGINGRQKAENRPFDMINLSGFNIGCFALPFAQSFLGPVGLVGVSLFDAGNSFMCTGINYTAAQFLQDRQGGETRIQVKKILRDLVSSGPFDTYLVVMLMEALKIPIPGFVAATAAVGANANAFIAMLLIGLSMEFEPEPAKLYRIGRLLGIRLLFSVACAVTLYSLVFIPVEVRQGLALVSLAPISTVAPAFTDKLGGDVGLSSTLNSVNIFCSVILLTGAMVLIL